MAFRVAVWMRGSGRRLQAGEYRFDRPMTTAEVVDKIARGDVYVRAITFREGLTNREMAALFEERRLRHGREFLNAAARTRRSSATWIPRRGISKDICFPTLTHCRANVTAPQLIERMVGRFRKALDAGSAAAAAAQGFTVRELVTLASLVEKETGKPEERPIVAGVYANRLEIGCRCRATRP